jgi:hypothetical protein
VGVARTGCCEGCFLPVTLGSLVALYKAFLVMGPRSAELLSDVLAYDLFLLGLWACLVCMFWDIAEDV